MKSFELFQGLVDRQHMVRIDASSIGHQARIVQALLHSGATPLGGCLGSCVVHEDSPKHPRCEGKEVVLTLEALDLTPHQSEIRFVHQDGRLEGDTGRPMAAQVVVGYLPKLVEDEGEEAIEGPRLLPGPRR